jgi:hypothetical protein
MVQKEALEAGLLGLLIIDNGRIPVARQTIPDTYRWSSREYQDLWYIITASYEKGAEVDAVAVKYMLDEGPEYGMGFQAGVATIARVLEAAPNIEMQALMDAMLN